MSNHLFQILTARLWIRYNSIFSQAWNRQAYEAALVTEDFLNGAAFDAAYTNDIEGGRLFAEIQANSSTYQRLNVVDCIKAYDKRAITDRKTVLVVTSSPRPTWDRYTIVGAPARTSTGAVNSIYAVDDFVGNEVASSTWDWMCDTLDAAIYPKPNCDLSDVLAGKADWSPFAPGIKVDYCLSDYVGESCTLEFCKCHWLTYIECLLTFQRSD